MFNRSLRSRRRDQEPSVRRHIFWGVLGCLLLGLLVYGVWYLTRLPSVTLTHIEVEGGETIEASRIVSTVNAALEGSYMSVVPHRFFLTYPEEEVLASILSIDRVKTADVDRKGRKNVTVSFSEYSPYALWCLSVEDKTSCYFLDEDGYAFGESPSLQGGSLIRHVVEGTDALEERQRFEPPRFKEMHAFLDALHTELGLRVTHVAYSPVGDITLYVNGGGKIYLHDEGPYMMSLENLKTVLASNSFKHLKPGNFQYVDLRFGNKVFVNEEPETVDMEPATGTAATST